MTCLLRFCPGGMVLLRLGVGVAADAAFDLALDFGDMILQFIFGEGGGASVYLDFGGNHPV